MSEQLEIEWAIPSYKVGLSWIRRKSQKTSPYLSWLNQHFPMVWTRVFVINHSSPSHHHVYPLVIQSSYWKLPLSSLIYLSMPLIYLSMPLIYLSNMGIFHSKLLVDQRVMAFPSHNHWFKGNTIETRRFSLGFSMGFDGFYPGSKAGRGAAPMPMWPASMVRSPWPKPTRPSPWGGTCLGRAAGECRGSNGLFFLNDQ